ncbi:MAG TPA: inositol 2-dehydrogenase [Thermoleophilaceae bacterium]
MPAAGQTRTGPRRLSSRQHSQTPLRIGVIGVGRIGSMHAELLATQVDGAELAAVHDADEEASRAAGRDFGVRACASVAELLDSRDLDAVAICSSTGTHPDFIVAAANAGKPIFCEKPISLELAEVDRALAAVDAAGVPFQIGFNRRFDPAHQSVRDAVANGIVGDPHLVRISSRDPAPPPIDYIRASGGIFLDMTIHDFDMARFVTASEVTQVSAHGAVRVDPAIADAGDVDTALVTLVHDNGCLTAIDNSRQAVYGFDQRVEVFGSRGMAASDNPSGHTGVVRTADGAHGAPLPYFFLDRYVPSYVREWEAFVGAVRTGETPAVTGADARAPLVIGLAAKRSLEEGRPVALDEVDR